MADMTIARDLLTIDGVDTPLLDTGPAEAREAVLFVHGAPALSSTWAPIMKRLYGVHRMVAPDMPGFGRAGRAPGANYSSASGGRHLAELADRLGLERVHLVVHDFGAPWALWFASAASERIASITFMSTGLMLDFKWHPMGRIMQWRLVGELIAAAMKPRWALRAALSQSNPRALPAEQFDEMHACWSAETRQALVSLYRNMSDVAGEARRFAEALAPHHIPALVIWGADDWFLPWAERQREVFDVSEVLLVPNSGHWSFLDEPDLCANAMRRFYLRLAIAEASLSVSGGPNSRDQVTMHGRHAT